MDNVLVLQNPVPKVIKPKKERIINKSTPTQTPCANNARFLITPMISVHTDELYLYGKREWISEPTIPHKNSLSNLLNNNHGNKLSIKAKRKAAKAVKYLLYTAGDKTIYNPKYNSSFKFKVGFITLTLPSAQTHTDQEIKALCLNQFLIEASKKWQMNNYVWKAERQANGNLHFHILTDVFIPHADLRCVWNRIINKLGYVDEYKKIHNKNNPNSSDIHSLWKIKNVSKYITKYMTKPVTKEKNKTTHSELGTKKQYDKTKTSVTMGAKKYLQSLSSTGKIWSCSRSLSNLEGGRAELDEYIKEEVKLIQSKKRAKRIDKDYVSMLFFDAKDINAKDTPILHSLLTEFVKKKFDLQHKHITYPPLPPDNTTYTLDFN